ncbi:MAG: hypothetical protein ABI415_06405 [Flavitalea sp.]
MAVSNNAITAGLTGTLGKQLVFRTRNGKTFVSSYPNMSERKLSAKQKKMNEIMKGANVKAKEIMSVDKDRDEAQVRLNVPRNRLYNALIKEYLRKELSEMQVENEKPT